MPEYYMNPRLARRPQFHGMPIPYVQHIRADGVPDFKVVDEERRWECVDKRRCGLCGESLDYWVAFIGGPLCVENRAYVEPPMHVACVQDAMKICPYLCKGKEFAQHVKSPDDDIVYETEDFASDQRPDRMGIYVTRDYTVSYRSVGATEKAKIIEPSKPARIEWYDEQGDLLEVER